MSNEENIREYLGIARQLAAQDKLPLLVYLIEMALIENARDLSEDRIVLESGPSLDYDLLTES
ncbi:hypothetical protein MRS76_19575 [Rhizobiaceae bacterium n13]|uniref:Uncharacterized protein n=1 Tax=Ferirhizobium litorale TaxID=2927786 RepID=A0AAE3QEX8_9HYPH|nr:hypothetical protein [Fererhizobium litorale]MDI7864150.1 hypothetical protein [Fererhizobium litorale]MDI7923761.1 hypothetical protein [Fererhizobium litorale]